MTIVSYSSLPPINQLKILEEWGAVLLDRVDELEHALPTHSSGAPLARRELLHAKIALLMETTALMLQKGSLPYSQRSEEIHRHFASLQEKSVKKADVFTNIAQQIQCTFTTIARPPTPPRLVPPPMRPSAQTPSHQSRQQSHENGHSAGPASKLMTVACDAATSMATHVTPMPKMGLFTYATVAHWDSERPLQTITHGACHLGMESALEHLGAALIEGAAETGVDATLIRAFVPKLHILIPVMAAHVGRITGEWGVEQLDRNIQCHQEQLRMHGSQQPLSYAESYQETFPWNLDDPQWSLTDSYIALNLLALPGKGLQAAERAIFHLILNGLHTIGVTDDALKRMMPTITHSTRSALPHLVTDMWE